MLTISSLNRLARCAIVSVGVIALGMAVPKQDKQEESGTTIGHGDRDNASAKSAAVQEPAEQGAVDAEQKTPSEGSVGFEIVRPSYANASLLLNTIRPFVAEKPVRLSTDQRTNAILLMGSDDQRRIVRDMINQLDISIESPTPVGERGNWPWYAGPGQAGTPAIEFFPLSGQSEIEKEITEKLSRQVSLEFVETPVSDVIDFLRHYTGVNIVLNKPAIEKEGVNGDTPVSIHVQNIPLKSALKILLAPYNLTYLIKHDVLQITSQLDAGNELVHLMYPVGDLCAGGDLDSLMQLIEQTISPNSWSSVGGAGTIQPFQSCPAIVIHQTQAVHEQLLGCLRTLRELKALDDGRHPKSNPDAVREELSHRLRVLREVELIHAREKSEANGTRHERATSNGAATGGMGGLGGF